MALADEQLLKRLQQLDDAADIDVTSEEADLLELLCFKVEGPLTPEQRELARRLLRKYRF